MSAPKGFLLVFSEPGPAVPEDEFHDWYDNEHVPLRIDVPTFSSWTRWEQIDGQKPSWAAYYDLESFEATQVPPYSRLAETRSEREKGILPKLEVLDRRTYEVYTGHPGTPPSTLYDPKKSAGFMVLVEADLKPEHEADFNRWYDEEHIPLLAKAPGWVRSRRFVIKDDSCIGAEGAKRTEKPLKYLTVHEWTVQDFPDSPGYKHATNTPWRTEVMENVTKKARRVFKLYKEWQRD
ncbi:hypothetical protein OF83DRAFT_1162783 [Amylostereum chailletii]|nr:hypothetical protein OF83DRAFT_1162783 [Amylostereum chailletii]